MKIFFDSIFYSYAQIFFSNRKWFGIIAMLISFVDPKVGIMGLLGVVLSNAYAFYLKFDKEKIRNGFYGFNGILIGAAIAYFFQLTPFIIAIAVVFIFLAFFMSASLEHLMANIFNLPGLSFPFILTLYVFLIVITNFHGVLYRDLISPSNAWITGIPDWLNLFFTSVALILLQSKAIAGLLLILLILAFSRVMFINAIIAFTFNYAIVVLLLPEPSHTLLILTSFNAILTAFALGGSMIIISKKTIPLLFLNIFFVVIFTLFFNKILTEKLLPVLVLPFNIVTLSTIYSLKFRRESTDLTLLYFKPGSPEENYYFHKARTARFSGFKYLFPEFPFWGEWKITQAFEGKITHKDNWKYAWDFEIADEKGNFFSGNGTEVSDFYCFNTPVVAPLDGKIVRVVDGIPDNKIGEVNLEHNWGNTVIIDHGEGLFSSLSHLKKKSIIVKEGDEIRKGEMIARCGNSGRSPQPHLHFQFQLIDKIGAETYKYPFAHYITINAEGKENLKIFDYPDENEIVKNIDTHNIIKNSFTFNLGDEFVFDCDYENKKFTEKWRVDVDSLNTLFIQNNQNDKLLIYETEKLFYATNYIGKRNSALYAFYLAASKVPLGFSSNLCWDDVLPLSSVVRSPIRFFQEFFLIVGNTIKVNSKFKWTKNENEVFLLKSNIFINGQGIFSFYKKKISAQIKLNQEKGIEKISFTKNNKTFKATKGDNPNENVN